MNPVLRFLLGKERPLPDKNFFPEVTVLIPAYNEEACIAETIQSIKDQTYFVGEIIVIDDCSTDRTGEIALRAGGVEVLRTPQNVGSKSRALNFALPYVESEVVVFVDADTVLEPNAISRAVRHFQHANIGMVSGFVVSKNYGNFWERGRLGEYLNGCGVNKTGLDNADAVIIATGCFMLARTEIVNQLGGFKERTMAEDMDLTWEVIEAGYSIRHEPSAVCHVSDPPNWSIYNKQMTRWMQGFFQCVKARHNNPFARSKKLGSVVSFYMLMALFGPVLFAYSIFSYGAAPTIGVMILTHFLLVGVPTIFYGNKMGYGIVVSVRCWTDMFGLQFVNSFIFYRSFANEYIFNKTLTTWEKGH